MILLTIGTQLPFDRLVKALDEMAPKVPHEIFAQIGISTYKPRNMQWAVTLGPEQFETRFREAAIIVSHAGIGTILSAQKHRKPIVVVPRLARFGEHRNDHQLATANQIKDKKGVYVATEFEALEVLLNRTDLESAHDDSETSRRTDFVNNLRTYLATAI
jgi:UDP-N-acetylglucosamine transferase subunit ALG13